MELGRLNIKPNPLEQGSAVRGQDPGGNALGRPTKAGPRTNPLRHPPSGFLRPLIDPFRDGDHIGPCRRAAFTRRAGH